MDDDQPTRVERSLTTLAIWLIVAALLLPLLYVLSAGPALWLVEHGYLSDARFAWLYFPVNYVYDRSEPVKDILDVYLSLWGRP